MGHQKVRTNIGNATAKEILTVTTVVGFTVATIPQGCVSAHCTLTGADVRYYYDGSTPTTLLGHLLSQPASFDVVGENAIKNFKVVAVSGTATIVVTYELEG